MPKKVNENEVEKKIKVGGVEYNLTEFKNKMYENHWSKESDDAMLDALFSGYQKAQERNAKNRKSKFREGEKLMTSLLSIPVTPDKSNSFKYDTIKGFTEWRSMMGDENEIIIDYRDGLYHKKIKENHAEDKATFIKQIKRQKWYLPGDDELFGNIFEARYNKDGKYDPVCDVSTYALNMEDRDKLMARAKEKLTKRGDNTDADKKALEGIDKQAERKAIIEEAEKFVSDVVKDQKWFYGSERTLRNMYLATEGLPKDHPYVQQLENIRQGITGFHPEFPLKKDLAGKIYVLQTYEEFKKAKELLAETKLETPAVKEAIDNIDQRLTNIRTAAEREREQLPLIVAWNGWDADQLRKFDELEDAINADKQNKPDFRVYGLGYIAKGINNCLGMEEGTALDTMAKLPEMLPQYMERIGMAHPAYEKALAVLEIVAPEKAKNLRADVEYVHKSEQLQERMDAFDKEMEGFNILKENLAKVEKAYFRHKNSPQYNDMIQKLDDVCKATSEAELAEAKNKLMESAKKYLEHTGLDAASSLHPNAEIRRLCAYDILAKTNEEVFEDFANRGNKERGKDDKISRERLENLPGVGKRAATKNKSNINNLILEENAENPKQEKKGKKKTITNKEEEAPKRGKNDILVDDKVMIKNKK